MRMGNSIPHDHEDHLAGNGENSLQHYHLVHKLIPMPQAVKIPAAKAAVDKEWEKFEKISAWNLKVKSKKQLSSMEDPVVPLDRNLYGHPLAGLLWEKQFEKILLKHGWDKIPNCECLFVHREKGLFLSVYVDDIKLPGKKQNLDPMWKLLNKEVDLGEQHLSWIMHTRAALNDNAK